MKKFNLFFAAVMFCFYASAEEEKSVVTENVTVLNKGIGGCNTQGGLLRFERDVLAEKPQHLVIFFGINDAVNSENSVRLENYRENLKKMVSRAQEKNILITLVTSNPVIEPYLLARHKKEFYADESPNEKISKYSDVVREIAAENKIPLVDLNAICKARGEPKEDASSILRNKANAKCADGVHLTAAGYGLLAGEVFKAIREKVKAGDVVVCFGDSLTFGSGMKGAGTADGDTYPGQLKKILNDYLASTANPSVAVPPPGNF